ncbi:MAG: NMD3-related protein [bacterium]|nr:NMD3-related protein [bacterium]
MSSTSRSSRRNTHRKGYKASRHAMEEFGGGKRDIIICHSCSAVYYYKSWHHNMLHYGGDIEKKQSLQVSLCPACAMWKGRQWEGELRVAGVPSRMKKQVTQTILSTADEAYRRDPMHRVFNIQEKGKYIKAYFSENQLTNRVAKKLVSSFKKRFSKPSMRYGKGEDAVLISMDWIV